MKPRLERAEAEVSEGVKADAKAERGSERKTE